MQSCRASACAKFRGNAQRTRLQLLRQDRAVDNSVRLSGYLKSFADGHCKEFSKLIED